ncbi:unnamed protein product [Phytomonas sp. Hart1]|nr:unnamed protein product [Phytomonas sp. Hart1]|eukprot:CCW67002.1 unnamed protein product [Phytomonas sp. isolate Hart1]
MNTSIDNSVNVDPVCDSLREVTFISPHSLKETEQISSSHDLENTRSTPSSPIGKLTLEQIHESLSTFNHNPEGLLVYTKISLCSLGLCNIDLLETYVFLQHITLDHNSLITLQPLRALQNLVFVSAKSNQLSESVFEDLEGNARTLETLYLEDNMLKSLEGLQHFKYLSNLCISQNRISSLRLAHFSSLSSLLRLDVSSNQIDTVEISVFSGSQQLRYVDLSRNSIRHLHFVAHVTTNLETLIFAHNMLRHLPLTLVQCHAIVRLDLSHNYLENVEDFVVLSSLGLLRHLSVQDNPFLHPMQPFPNKQPSLDDNIRDDNNVIDTGGVANDRADDTGALKQLLSHSEITYEDDANPTNDDHHKLLNPFTTDTLTVGRGVNEASKKTMPTYNFADMTASYVYGLVRHTLVSCRVTPTLCEIDPTSKLATLPYDRQVNLYLISILPQLATLDQKVITDDDVSRATIYFKTITYADPHKESLDGRNISKEIAS